MFLAPSGFGLDLPVPLYLFPLVSGYVGGDLVAFLFGQPYPAPGTFYLDVGTNGEMAVNDGERWWTTRITSYNVCYTKLLRPMLGWPLNPDDLRRRQRRAAPVLRRRPQGDEGPGPAHGRSRCPGGRLV